MSDIEAQGPERPVATQEAHPAKAALRTFIQALIASLVILQALPLIMEELAQVPFPEEVRGWLVAASAFLAALAAAVSRIMAIPAVNDLLDKIGVDTGAKKG